MRGKLKELIIFIRVITFASNIFLYFSFNGHPNDHSRNKIKPKYVQTLQYTQKDERKPITKRAMENLIRVIRKALNEMKWEYNESCDKKRCCETSKKKIAGALPFVVIGQFCRLQKYIACVVYYENKGPHVHLICQVGKANKHNRSNVMNKHFPKIFPPNVKELGD